MLAAFRIEGHGLAPSAPSEAVWIDLFDPDEAERARAASLIGAAPPTKEEQDEIETSSRLYVENGVAVMTALLPAYSQSVKAEIAPVTFMLGPERLVTVRRHTPRPFETWPARAGKAAIACSSPSTVLIGLLEEVIDRLADITEIAGRSIDSLSARTFETEGAVGAADLRATLKEIGRLDGRLAQLGDSLVTMERLLGFLTTVIEPLKPGKDAKALLKAQLRDVRTISEQTARLSQKTAFLLDATLGLINVEQNGIIKIFSVVAVVFLPPTLVASIYGMNFRFMPELDWPWGYPLALLLMALSAAAPLAYFRRKGWF